MSFPRYPKYKTSGVDWLGDVPEHWQRRTLKQIVSTPITDGPHETPNFPDEGIPFVSAEAVAEGKIDFSKIRGFISREDHARYSEKYLPRRGDIYMVKSGATTGVTAIVETDDEFNIWSPLAAIRCGREALPRFVLNYLRSRNFLEGVTLNWSFGTQQNIGMRVIENLSIPIPPVDEQAAIAAFLDRETAKIDGLVAEQQRLIELLKEKRQAVISHAVTKGLNPAAPMKPSGIDWLGDVPSHWQVKKLHYLLRESPKNGLSPEITVDGTIPTFSIAAVRNGVVNLLDHLKFISLDQLRVQDYQVEKGDILVLRGSGSKELVGTAGIVVVEPPANCIYPDILIRIRPNSSVGSCFLVTCINSIAIRPQVELAAQTAAGIWKVSGGSLDAIRLPLPPLTEQAEIEAHVQELSSRFDGLTAEAERAIELLQERRTALISAAVTGRIDVRGLAGSEAA